MHSLLGALVGGVAGYFSVEIGDAVSGLLHIDVGDDKIKKMVLGIVATLIVLPTLGYMILGRLSKTWSAFGVIVGAVIRAFQSGLFKKEQTQQQPQ